MALSPEQEKIWEQSTRDIVDPEIDFSPVMITTEDVLNTPIDLMQAVIYNFEQNLIKDEDKDRVMNFIEDVISSGRPSAIIAELQYTDTSLGRYVKLEFPTSDEIYEQ